MPQQASHHEIQLPDGGTLRVTERGNGPPVLFISGLGGTAGFWKPVIEGLAGFKTYCFDQRGIAGTHRGDRPCTISQLAEDCIALLDTLRLPAVHVVGHSTGGCIAQELALSAPARVSSLVLSGTWAKADLYMKELFGLRAALLRRAPELYEPMGAVLSCSPAWLRQTWSSHPPSAASGELTESAIQVRLERIAALLSFDRTASLRDLQCPVRIVGADDDWIVPAYLQDELEQLTGACRRTRFTSGGHFFPITQSKDYTLMIHHWLTTEAAACTA